MNRTFILFTILIFLLACISCQQKVKKENHFNDKIFLLENNPQLYLSIIRKTKCSQLFKRSDISCKTKRPPKNNFPQHSKDSKKASENFVSPDAFFFK